MATITGRNVDDQLQARLRMQAAQHNHSMEGEAKHILRAALFLEPARPTSLAAAIRAQIEPVDGIVLKLPERDRIRNPAALDA